MMVLLIGATGFLGSAIHSALVSGDHQVVATYHRCRPPGSPVGTQWRRADIGALSQAQWAALLGGCEAVVNCAGVLQTSPWESTERVHAKAMEALIKACEVAGVRRVVHFSAIGADRHQASDFSRSKRQGEVLLM